MQPVAGFEVLKMMSMQDLTQEQRRRVNILLSLQRALTYHVKPNLRLVTCRISTNPIILRAIIDGEIGDEDRDILTTVETELISDLDWDECVELEMIRSDAPASLRDFELEEKAYARFEGFGDE